MYGDHGEDPSERRHRELIELLNELRVALPGVQVRFTFLLVVPFSRRFTVVTPLQLRDRGGGDPAHSAFFPPSPVVARVHQGGDARGSQLPQHRWDGLPRPGYDRRDLPDHRCPVWRRGGGGVNHRPLPSSSTESPLSPGFPAWPHEAAAND